MVLNTSPHEPCLPSGVLNNPSSPASTSDLQSQLHVGLYVKYSVFYSSDPSQENLFKTLLQAHSQVYFMGNVDCFSGTAFTWIQHADGDISVHLCQLAFTNFNDHWLSFHTANKVPNMTLYRSGLPIDSIPPFNSLYPDLPRQKQVYLRVVRCINWLATFTRPDISPALTFIASYINSPRPQHYKAAVHFLTYLMSTNEYGISFNSNSSSTIQAFNHSPHHHNK